MPNTRSAKKNLRKSEKRRLSNQSVKSALKTYVRSAKQSAGGENAEEKLRNAVKMLDKAAERGIIHKNQAARRKSRLAKAVDKAKDSK
jgi:small subunit ribosomal protein S20